MSYDNYLEYNIDSLIDENLNSVTNNTSFTYDEIVNGRATAGIFSDPMESKILYFNKTNTFKGDVVAELQKKLALIFYYRNFNLIFKKYYIDDVEYKNAITSCIYGPKTTLSVMQFQSIYMKSIFKDKWSIEYGFGIFGENTKDTLDGLYRNSLNALKNSNRTSQARQNTILAGAGYL